jgi:hypothetical protein
MDFETIFLLNDKIKTLTTSMESLAEEVKQLPADAKEAVEKNVIGNGLLEYHVDKLKEAFQ